MSDAESDVEDMPLQCTACRLPVEARRQIENAYRRKVPIRRIATDLAIAGHSLAAATIHRHCTRCLAPEDVDPLDSLTLMVLVRNALRWQHSAAEKVTNALVDVGATAEAAIMATACLESYRPALERLPGEGLAMFMLEGYALADVVRRVLSQQSVTNATTATAMAKVASEIGADDLAEALHELASRAAGTTDGQAGESTGYVTARLAPNEGSNRDSK